MLRRCQGIVAGIFLIGIALFYVKEILRPSLGPHAATNYIGHTSTKYEQRQKNVFGAFWRWTTSDAVSFYTAILSIFSGILVVVSFIQIRYLILSDKTARIAAEAAEKAANSAIASNELSNKQFIADNRPWLSVKVKPASDFIFNASGTASIDIKYTICNVGKSPALRVKSFGICPDTSGRVVTREFERYRIAFKTGHIIAPVINVGEPLFPNEIITYTKSVTIPVDGGVIQPIIFICVQYSPSDNSAISQTAYMIDVTIVDDQGINWPLSVNEGNISIKRINFSHFPIGAVTD